MDHAEAIRLSATERYLLDELSPEQKDQFEEHFFSCVECAEDVRAASVFINQSKELLYENHDVIAIPGRQANREAVSWYSRFRLAFAVPVFAALIAVIGYQNLVTYPQLRAALDRPQVVPWTSIMTRTRGSNTEIVRGSRGGTFLLMVTIPPDSHFTSYVADLYDPAGNREWSLPVVATEDPIAIQVPTANHQAGKYAVALRGIDANGQSKELSRDPFELQIEN